MDNERILKEAAKLYVQRMGEALTREAEVDLPVNEKFDPRFRQRLRSRIFMGNMKKVAFIAAPVAACLLIAFFITQMPSGLNTEDNTALFIVSAPYVEIDAPVSVGDNDASLVVSAPFANADALESAPPAEIAFLSARLPEGYDLTFTDYDHDKTIYYINNNRDNEIMLVAGYATEPLLIDEGFVHTRINKWDAYVLARKDYNVLMMYAEGVQYTFTSFFDAADLVEVAGKII